MAFRYAKTPPRTLEELSERVLDLVSQLDRVFSVIKDCEIGTDETAIAHGLHAVPKMAIAVPHNITRWCETKKPDAKNIYLRASQLCVCDVWVIP